MFGTKERMCHPGTKYESIILTKGSVQNERFAPAVLVSGVTVFGAIWCSQTHLESTTFCTVNYRSRKRPLAETELSVYPSQVIWTYVSLICDNAIVLQTTGLNNIGQRTV